MNARVLISDSLSPAAINVFVENGIDAVLEPELGKNPARLVDAISEFDGLAVRSATKVTGDLLAEADSLQVIGRAGIGVDNIDLTAATQRGVVVMNTPFGNSVTTAEHAIAMMMALARQIPSADASTRAGKWEKSRFMGIELTGKTLGVIGCGNIGSIVVDRALGLKMKVMAYDPFLTTDRAHQLGVVKCELDELLAASDVVTLHVPLTDKTRGIIDANSIARMRPGVRIINCARGGLIDENALKEGLECGHVAGAALDVFEVEPAKQNPLFELPNVICTPHLGAATTEAQEMVALQVAEQMSEFLMTGAISNALNFPSVTREEAPRLRPWCELSEKLGSLAGQLNESAVETLRIEFAGDVSNLNTRLLSSALLTGILKPTLESVNLVSAASYARERGIKVEEVRCDRAEDFTSYIRLTVSGEAEENSYVGTVMSDGVPRVIEVNGVDIEARMGPNMLFVKNDDRPGFIGALGSALGFGGVNIATFQLGRSAAGANAMSLVETDTGVSDSLLASICALPNVRCAKRLAF